MDSYRVLALSSSLR